MTEEAAKITEAVLQSGGDEGTAAPKSSPEGSGEGTGVPKSLEPQKGAGDGVASSDATSAPQESEAPKGQWPKSAIDEVTKARARVRDSSEKIAKLTARLQEFEAKGTRPIDPTTGTQFTEEQINAMVNEKAHLLAKQNEWNIRCNATADRGAKKFEDWKPRFDSFYRLVDNNDPQSVQRYNMFLEAAIETGKGDEIIHALGGDLNEAARILSLSPMKMAMEVGRMVKEEREAPEPESRLPRPIRPVGSKSPSTAARPDDPERGAEIPMKDWVKARDAQVLERKMR